MANLNSRFKEFNKARRDLLQILSCPKDGVPDLDSMSKEELDDARLDYPMAPLLQCDFRILYRRSLNNQERDIWADDWLIEGLDFSPSELTWGYENTPIGFPTPKVANTNCSITFMMPSSVGVSSKLQSGKMKWYETLIGIYNYQFSERGLPTIKSMQQSFTVYAIASTVQKNFLPLERDIPLFRLSGLRFGTPKFSKFDPATMQPLSITMPFAYSSSKFFEFDSNGPTLDGTVQGLSSIYQDDQFDNR